MIKIKINDPAIEKIYTSSEEILKIIQEEKLVEIKAEMLGFKYLNLLDYEVPEDVLNFLPEEIARTYKTVCFARENKTIKVGMIEPNLKAMEAVDFLAND